MNKIKTIILIFIGALSVVLIAIGIKLFISNNEDKKQLRRNERVQLETSYLNDNDYAMFQKDGKYGYIDLTGNIVIEPQFEYANKFEGNYALVKNNSKDKMFSIINKKGEKVKETKGSASYNEYNNYWNIDNKLYDKDLKDVTPKDISIVSYSNSYYLYYTNDKKEMGLLNSNLEKTYSRKYSTNLTFAASSTQYGMENTYCGISNLIVNCDTGKEIYNLKENEYISMSNNNYFIINNVDSNEFIKAIYVEDDKIVFTLNEETNLYYYYNYGDPFLYIESTKKYYSVLNKKFSNDYSIAFGKVKYENSVFYNKNYKVEQCASNEESLYKNYSIKSENQEIIPCTKFEVFTDFQDIKISGELYKMGITPVVINDSLLNLETGKEIAKIDYKHSYSTINTLSDDSSFFTAYYYTKEYATGDVVTKIYNIITGKSIIINSDDRIIADYNYFIINKNGKFIYYNKNMEKIFECDEFYI